MKRFILKILLMLLLVVMTLGVVAVINKCYFMADNYLMEFPVKQRLVSDTPSPKLVVLGGSNVAFGIDSKMLSDSLGMPVINASLHAGLGLRYIMHANTTGLRKGDILVIMPEYEHFLSNLAWGNSATISVVPYFATSRELFDMNREQFALICKGWGRESLKMLVEGIKGSLQSNHNGKYQYLKSGFDERGDELSHRYLPSDADMSHYKSVPCFTSFNEKYMKEFFSEVYSLQNRGVRVILLPPAILDSSLAADRRMIEQLSKKFSAAKMAFAASIDTFAYPNKFLYNTNYHLNANGVKLNTKHFLFAIKPKIKQID